MHAREGCHVLYIEIAFKFIQRSAGSQKIMFVIQSHTSITFDKTNFITGLQIKTSS